MGDIYNEEKLTVIRVLQYILLGALIPLITGALVIELMGDVGSVFEFIPLGFWFSSFVSILFLLVMYAILQYIIHPAFAYINIEGKARLISDIAYFVMSILVLLMFEFPQP